MAPVSPPGAPGRFPHARIFGSCAAWRAGRGRPGPERRCSTFTGPLAVAALSCTSSWRIAALVTLTCLPLLIFCPIERQARQALAKHGRAKIEGLHAGRPAIPAGRLIHQAP